MTPLPRPVWPGKRDKPDDYQRRSIESFLERQQSLIDAEVEGQERMARAWAKPRPPRRITQLCAMSETLYALCSDGSVWERRGATWVPEPGIPQRQALTPEHQLALQQREWGRNGQTVLNMAQTTTPKEGEP